MVVQHRSTACPQSPHTTALLAHHSLCHSFVAMQQHCDLTVTLLGTDIMHQCCAYCRLSFCATMKKMYAGAHGIGLCCTFCNNWQSPKSAVLSDKPTATHTKTAMLVYCADVNGTVAIYNSSCYSNLFLSDLNQTSTAANKPGLTCPTMHLQRPANLSNLTTAYFYNYVAADPLLFSYEGCTCAQPLIPHYFVDTSGQNCSQISID